MSTDYFACQVLGSEAYIDSEHIVFSIFCSLWLHHDIQSFVLTVGVGVSGGAFLTCGDGSDNEHSFLCSDDGHLDGRGYVVV